MAIYVDNDRYNVLTDIPLIRKLDNFLPFAFGFQTLPGVKFSALFDEVLGSVSVGEPLFTNWLDGPPNISEFTNDVGYLTEGNIKSVDFEDVQPNDVLFLECENIVSAKGTVETDWNADWDFEREPISSIETEYWEHQELKGTITHFVVDTEDIAGHFIDGNGDPVTVGGDVGVDNLFVREGCYVVTSEDPLAIFVVYDIEDDSGAENGVKIQLFEGTYPVGTYPVVKIQATVIENGPLDAPIATLTGVSEELEEEFAPFVSTTDDISGYSIRQIVPADLFPFSANKIRVSLDGNGKEASFKGLSIGERYIRKDVDDWVLSGGDTMIENGAYSPYLFIDNDGEEEDYYIVFQGDGSNNSNLHQAVTGMTAGHSVDVSVSHSDPMGQTGWFAICYEDMGTWYYWNFDTKLFQAGAHPPSPGFYPDAGDLRKDWASAPYWTVESEIGVTVPASGEFYVLVSSSYSGHFVNSVSVKEGMTEYVVNGNFENYTEVPTSTIIGDITEVLFEGAEDIELNASNDYKATSDWIYVDGMYDSSKEYLLVMDIDVADDTYVDMTGESVGVYAEAATETRTQNTMNGGEALLTEQISFLSVIEIDVKRYPELCPYVILEKEPSYLMEGLTNLEIYGVDDVSDGDEIKVGYVFSFDAGDSWSFWVEGDDEVDPPVEPYWIKIASNKSSDHGGADGDWYYFYLVSMEPLVWEWRQTPSEFNTAQAAISLNSISLGGNEFPDSEDLEDSAFSFYSTGGYADDGNIMAGVVLYAEKEDAEEGYCRDISVDGDAEFTFNIPINDRGFDGGLVIASFTSVAPGIDKWLIFNGVEISEDPVIFKSLRIYYQ